MIEALAIAVNLAVFGAHVVAPWRLAAAPEAARRRWALFALPALLAALLATAAAVGVHPDAAIAWGLTSPFGGSATARVLAVLFVALGLCDGLLLVGGGALEPIGWRVAAGFGLLALAATSWSAELLRTGEGPVSAPGWLALASVARAVVALAAAEAIAPETGRRRWTLAAGIVLPLSFFAYHPRLRAALVADLPTLVAATGCFWLARFAPAATPRIARSSAIAGWLLAAVFLAQAVAKSSALGSTILPPGPP